MAYLACVRVCPNTSLYPGLDAGLDPTRGRLDPRLGRSAGWIKSAAPSWSETRIKTRSRLSARHSPWSSRTSCTFRVSQTFCRAARATASYALQALAAPPPPPTPPCRPVAASGRGLSTCESRCLVVTRAHSPSRVPCSPPPPPLSVPNGGLICLPFTLTTTPPPPPPPPPPPAHWGGLVVLQARRAARAGGPNPRRTAARAVHTCVWRAACA